MKAKGHLRRYAMGGVRHHHALFRHISQACIQWDGLWLWLSAAGLGVLCAVCCVLSLSGHECSPRVRRAPETLGLPLRWEGMLLRGPSPRKPRSSVTTILVTRPGYLKFITYVSTASNTYHLSHDLLSLYRCQTRRFNYSVTLIRNPFMLKLTAEFMEFYTVAHAGGFMQALGKIATFLE